MECLLAGAWAVQVGTATLIDPAAPVEVAREIARYLKAKRLARPRTCAGVCGVPGRAPRRGRRAALIPPPANPLIVALDVSDLDERRAPRRARSARTVGHAEGRLRAVLGARPRGRAPCRAITRRCSSTRSSTTSRTRSSGPRANIARLGVAMFNVHALGGEAMMRAALRGAERGPPRPGRTDAAGDRRDRAVLARAARGSRARVARVRGEGAPGCDGVVVSGEDVATCGRRAATSSCLVVPGIRPAGSNGDDQVRVLTPQRGDRARRRLPRGGPAHHRAADPAGVVRGIAARRRIAAPACSTSRNPQVSDA